MMLNVQLHLLIQLHMQNTLSVMPKAANRINILVRDLQRRLQLKIVHPEDICNGLTFILIELKEVKKG